MGNENEGQPDTLQHGGQVQHVREGAGVWGKVEKGAQPMGYVQMPTTGPSGAAPASDSAQDSAE
jgi:hypothetical protein